MTNPYRPWLQSTVAAVMLMLALALSGCSGCQRNSTTSNNSGQEGASSPPSSSPTKTAESPGPSAGDQNAQPHEPSLVSLSAGAFVVKKPQEYSSAYSVLELLDERPTTNWSGPRGVVTPEAIVIALPEKTVLKSVEFDCSGVSSAYTGSCAKDISVEMSDANENDGYQKIAEISLKEGADNQQFPVSAAVPGRWVRLTVKNNHGSPDFIQLNDFRATGAQLTHTAPPEVSGTYNSDLGDVHLRQEGTSVTGCYYTRAGVFEGGLESRVAKITWCDNCAEPNKTRGPAVLVFSPDGQRFVGLWWNEGNTNGAGGHWEGTKKSSDVGSCSQWAGGIEEQLTKDLEEFGRARVYGINFDTDSDRLKDESKPTLDKIAAILKAKPDWKVTIEGHTDSTSTPQHNQDLSERRAASVKSYLQSAGISASRMNTAGYGDTRPVAGNDTEIGRAQNRRVELMKQ